MQEPAAYRYGVARPEEIARMTGKEILQAIIDGRLPQPPISQTMSFWLTEIGDGVAAFEGEPGAHLLNPMGTVHGGWAMTLIDSATGCAGYSLIPAGGGFRTVETKANLSRPITGDASAPNPGAADWFVLVDATGVSVAASIVSELIGNSAFKPLVISSGTYNLMWDLAKSDLSKG